MRQMRGLSLLAVAFLSALRCAAAAEGEAEAPKPGQGQDAFEAFSERCAGQETELALAAAAPKDPAEDPSTVADTGAATAPSDASVGQPKDCAQLFAEAKSAAPGRLADLYARYQEKKLSAGELKKEVASLLPFLDPADAKRMTASVAAVEKQDAASKRLQEGLGPTGGLVDALNSGPGLSARRDPATGRVSGTFAGRSFAAAPDEKAALGKDGRLYIGNEKSLRWLGARESGFELPGHLGEARVRQEGGSVSRSVTLDPKVLGAKAVDLSAIPDAWAPGGRKAAYQRFLGDLPTMPQLGNLFAPGKPAEVVIRDGQLRLRAADKTVVLANLAKDGGKDVLEAIVLRGKESMLWRVDDSGARLLMPKSDKASQGQVDYELRRSYARKADGGWERTDTLGGAEPAGQGMWDDVKVMAAGTMGTVGTVLSPLSSALKLAVGTEQRVLGGVVDSPWNKFASVYTLHQAELARMAGYGLDTPEGQREVYHAALEEVPAGQRPVVIAVLTDKFHKAARAANPKLYEQDPVRFDTAQPSELQLAQTAAGSAGYDNAFGAHMANAGEAWDEGGFSGKARAAFNAAAGGAQVFAEAYLTGKVVGGATQGLMSQVVAARTGVSAGEAVTLAENSTAGLVTSRQAAALRAWDGLRKAEGAAGAGMFVAPAAVNAADSITGMARANGKDEWRSHAQELYRTAAGFAGVLEGFFKGGSAKTAQEPKTGPDEQGTGGRGSNPSWNGERAPHEVLGVREDASPAEIRTAFRDLVMRAHTDTNPGALDVGAAAAPSAAALRARLKAATTPPQVSWAGQTWDVEGVQPDGTVQLEREGSKDDFSALPLLAGSGVQYKGTKGKVASATQDELTLRLEDGSEVRLPAAELAKEPGQGLTFLRGERKLTVREVDGDGTVRLAPSPPTETPAKVRVPLAVFGAVPVRIKGRESEGLFNVSMDRGRLTATPSTPGNGALPQEVALEQVVGRHVEVESPEFGKVHLDSRKAAMDRAGAGARAPSPDAPPAAPAFGALVGGKTTVGPGDAVLDNMVKHVAEAKGPLNLSLFELEVSDKGSTPSDRLLDAVIAHARGDGPDGTPQPVRIFYNPVRPLDPRVSARIAEAKKAGADIELVVPRPVSGDVQSVNHSKTLASGDAGYLMTGGLSAKAASKVELGVSLPAPAAREMNEYIGLLAAPGSNSARRRAVAEDLARQGVVVNDPLLPNGGYLTTAVRSLLSNAKESLQVYVKELKDVDSTQTLIDQARAGVRVDVAIRAKDGIGEKSREMVRDALQADPGLPLTLKVYPKSGGPLPHGNLIVADGTRAYLGTAFLWTSHMSGVMPGGRAFDHGVLLEGADAARVQRQFLEAVPEPDADGF